MKDAYCNNCRKMTGHKRTLGWGTFFGGIFTGGFSLLIIPFYPKRCIICGMELSGKELSKSDNSRFFAEMSNVELKEKEISEENQTKKCPFCAEIIKFEAIKCRFCGEKLEPANAKQVEEIKKVDDIRNRVLCNDGNCIGIIGSDGRCKVCGKPFEEPNIEHDSIQLQTVHEKPFYKKRWLLLLIGLGVLFIIWSFFGGLGGSDNLSEPEKRLQKFNKMSAEEHLTEAKKLINEIEQIKTNKDSLDSLEGKTYQIIRHLSAITSESKEYVDAQSLLRQTILLAKRKTPRK